MSDDDGCMYFVRAISLLEGSVVPMPMISCDVRMMPGSLGSNAWMERGGYTGLYGMR